jgi:3-hydroxymyristoyl/3-hydroxydecanoyl-(acyl carrier protein) dehydratase
MRALQRDSEIYLPVGQMRLITSIHEFTADGIVCVVDLQDHWVFDLHFPGDPIFPGSLLIEAAGQTIATWAWEMGLRGAPRLVKVSAEFKSPLHPCDRAVSFHASIRRRKNLCVGKVQVLSEGRQIALVTGTLVVLGPAESASPLRVSLPAVN